MKLNSFLIRLAVISIVIFGGTFTIRYFRDGIIFIVQLIGAGVGVLLLAAAWIWKKKKS